MNRKIAYTYKPLRFYVTTFVVTWLSWFLSAWLSFNTDSDVLYVIAMLPGLVAPFVIALIMIFSSKNPELRKGFIDKLFNLKLIKVSSLPAIILIMPLTVLASISVSTLFGQSWDQLQLAEGFSFSAGFAPVLLVLFMAASFEELGWRSYAVDSLSERYSYFRATLIFSVLWALWHLPLFLIKDYYHYEILNSNPLFAINFMVSTIPLAFIISWVCKFNSGSISAAIFFHFLINLVQEAMQITQETKCIQTIILIGVAVLIVILNREIYFDKQINKVNN